MVIARDHAKDRAAAATEAGLASALPAK